MSIERLPIIYDIAKDAKLTNPFYERAGQFEDPYDEFIDICLNNLPWAAYHLLMWKSKPLELAPFQCVMLDTLWHKTFPILLASRGASKSFMLGVYAVMRAMLTPGSKVVIVASSFRQSKLVFEYVEQLYDASPILQQCCPKPPSKPSDSRELIVGDSVIKALPLGNGEKIRGVRATHILTDEFNSIPPEIFQVVVRGFAAVSADPIEAAKKRHMEDELIRQGKLKPSDRTPGGGNQIVYSGTAGFQFENFFKVYNIHKAIIESKFIGNADDVNSRFGLDEESDNTFEGSIDYRDYAIIQLPYEGLPKAFMDEKQIAQARATMPRALFDMEYRCLFPTDSDGFFRTSMINDATPGRNGDKAKAFSVETKGQPGFEYVMGIDPARKTDNFSISILKLMPNKTYRNVYCFSMNKKSWPVAVRKVRDLINNFNIVRIAMDAGGGGTTVEDLLQDDSHKNPGEHLIWRFNDDEHRRFKGRHILEMVNFSPGWIGQANYGLAADIENKTLLFPYRTSTANNAMDFEDVWEEIDEQKKETCMIVVTSTKTGVQHFDLPELSSSQQGTLKVHRRKDRYSALLLSTYAARTYWSEAKKTIALPSIGGWVDQL